MKPKIVMLFTALAITVCAKAQTVINQKGTKTVIDSSKWKLSGNIIYNKNSGAVGVGTVSPNQKLEVKGVNGLPTGMNAAVTNATLRVSGSGNNALDIGTISSGALGAYIELSQNLTAATTLPLVLNPSGGRVGIGVLNPDAPLHINGNAITTASLTRTYFQYQFLLPGLSSGTATTGNIQVHANGWYWADGGGFVATSDARIKNIIGLTNTEKDLETLSHIQVTNYTYIDKTANGAKPQKKVIAQQLRDVYPIAVNENAGVIPDVFETATSSRVVERKTYITTGKAHGFQTGDLVKLIVEETGEKILQVTVSDERSFSVAEAITGRIFVYGKKVNDLLSVDYDAVSMLNVSATQELAKQLKATQAKLELVESENKLITINCNELKKILIAMQVEIDVMKKDRKTKK